MSYATPGAYNTYIPNLVDSEATDALVVGFSRNPKSFRLNQYGQIRQVKRKAGEYLRISPDLAHRLLYADGRDRVWADGDDSPTGVDNRLRFEGEPYRTIRYADAVTLGAQAVEQAQFMVEALQQGQLVQKMMTFRTNMAGTALSSASWGGNTADVDGGLSGGQNWSNGSGTSPNFKNSILKAASIIKKATAGTVMRENLVLVMNPDTAIGASISPEFHNAMFQSIYALPQIRGDAEIDYDWGIPPRVGGVPVIIEDATYNSAADGATASNGYIIPTGTAYLLARPGGTVEFGTEETPVISTLMGFFLEELTVQSRTDQWQRRTEIRIATEFSYVVSSVLSGFKFTRVLG